MIPLAPAGIPIGIHPGTDGQLREKNRLKSFFLSSVSFASIAFGYPQRIFGVNPKPPRPRKCYDFLNFGHFPLTGWEVVCYLELAEILCTAPLQLNTQHNRYFTLPVGRTAWSRQTITRDWGEGIMILLLPHASDGVTALGL